MPLNTFKTVSVVLLTVALAGSGGGVMAFTGDGGHRGGYQPPGVGPVGAKDGLVVVNDGMVTRPGQVALDANGGRNNPYLREPDATNVNHHWELRKVGGHHMLLPRVGGGKLALDANGGRNYPYFRKADPTNSNHLWKLIRFDSCYLIVPKVAEGELALHANGGKGNPSLSKHDATDNSCLWELRKAGDYYMIYPLVRREVAPKQGQLRQLREDARREIEKLIKRGEEAGVDRRAVLDEVEKAVQEMRAK